MRKILDFCGFFLPHMYSTHQLHYCPDPLHPIEGLAPPQIPAVWRHIHHSQVHSLPLLPVIDPCCRQDALNLCQGMNRTECSAPIDCIAPTSSYFSLGIWKRSQMQTHTSAPASVAMEWTSWINRWGDKQAPLGDPPTPSASHHITSFFLISHPSFLHPAFCLFAEGMLV